jgi:hypothetical protein
MSVVRREIKLSDLGIAEIRPRRALTGALIFKIAGRDTSSKASRLKRWRLLWETIKATVPRKMAELRETGLEDSITPEEVAAAVAVTGGCQTAEVSVGVIRSAHWGLGSVWLRCPLTAARKIGSSSGGGRDALGGRLHIGWSAARVTLTRHANTSATHAWRRAMCAGIAPQRSTGWIFASGAAWKGIV